MAAKTRSVNQLNPLGEEKDRADSQMVYQIFKALHPLTLRWPDPGNGKRKGKGRSQVNRALREAIQKIWQEPRMPKGKKGSTLIFSHNKPLDFPWTPDARDLYFEHKADSTVQIKGMLVLEHATPINILVKDILEKMSDDDYSEEAFHDLLLKEHEQLCFVILTKAEDDKLTAKKLKSVGVLDESATPWTRYWVGCELREEDFMAITADPRYGAEQVSDRG